MNRQQKIEALKLIAKGKANIALIVDPNPVHILTDAGNGKYEYHRMTMNSKRNGTLISEKEIDKLEGTVVLLPGKLPL